MTDYRQADPSWPAPKASVEQPMPVANDRPSIQGMVRADLDQREKLGRERYGTSLQAHNGRDALRDAYEEALDLACYLRQMIEERGSDREVLNAVVAAIVDDQYVRWSYDELPNAEGKTWKTDNLQSANVILDAQAAINRLAELGWGPRT